MSTFKVVLTKIEKLWSHPNADRLDLAKAMGLGYQFCVQKGTQAEGNEVVYFQIDSLLPVALAENLGVRSLLAGKNKDRIKTVRLRGEISQGLVISSETIKEYLSKKGLTWPQEDLAGALGVTKYEPPEVSCKTGTLRKLPDGVPVYDVEGADNFPEVVKELMYRKVVVTEKMEGTNYSITVTRDGEVMVNQRGYTIVPIEGGEHEFWRATRLHGYADKAKGIQDGVFPGKQVTLRGELIGPGVQKNIYGLKTREVLFFDILVDGKYASAPKWRNVCQYWGLKTVPILSQDKTLSEWLGGRTMQEASNGPSAMGAKKREGVVVKPVMESVNHEVGRLMIKQRSPEYLAKSDL